jgi:hypothetical protein
VFNPPEKAKLLKFSPEMARLKVVTSPTTEFAVDYN